jgi:hypothetical protein
MLPAAPWTVNIDHQDQYPGCNDRFIVVLIGLSPTFPSTTLQVIIGWTRLMLMNTLTRESTP